MAPATQVRKLTYEDYVQFPEDGMRHEILDGAHYMSPSPRVRHQRVARNLTALLWSYCRTTGAGEVLPAPTDVVLARHDIVVPDLIFVAAAHRDRLTELNLRGAPDLAVEILSPGTAGRDLGLKRQRYEASGVEEYWLIEPAEQWLRVLRRAGGAFVEQPELRAGDRLASPLLPGLSLDVAEIFA